MVATLGPAAFAVLFWGVIVVVLLIFAFEVYAVARDAGWV